MFKKAKLPKETRCVSRGSKSDLSGQSPGCGPYLLGCGALSLLLGPSPTKGLVSDVQGAHPAPAETTLTRPRH